MEPKGDCSLAVTQILHLHLYKTSPPVCFSGSHTLFLFHSQCAAARGVVIFSMFSVRLAPGAMC